MPEYRSSLIEYYGGTNKTFQHLKDIEMGLHKMYDDDIISEEERDNRIIMIKQFKKTLRLGTN